jgi:hypothetical protein
MLFDLYFQLAETEYVQLKKEAGDEHFNFLVEKAKSTWDQFKVRASIPLYRSGCVRVDGSDRNATAAMGFAAATTELCSCTS